MTFAGKKFKNLFDGGQERLKEIERTVSENLKQTANEHSSSRKNGDSSSISLIENKSKELEADLKNFMDKSIERLQKTMEVEVKETEDHLGSVKLDLSNLSDKLKHSIADLKRSYDDQVHHIRTTLADQYEGAIENTNVELEKQDHAIGKHLRAHGTFVMNSLQQKLDHSLWESRGEEKQYNSSLFKTFMQKANTIDTHFSQLMQRLSDDFQTHYKALEITTSETELDLNQQSHALLTQVGQHSSELEAEIQEFFKNTMEGHRKTLDESLANIAQDLSSVHDSTTKRLSEQTREMTASLLTASGDARTHLGEKCAVLREQVDERLQSFFSRCTDRVSASAILKDALEKEQNTIYQNVRTELADIRSSFEKRMTALMTDAVKRVHSITEEAERDISAVQHVCQNQLRVDSVGSKNEIDAAISNFLTLLSAQKNLALEEIAKSATGTGQADRASEAKAKRRKPKDPTAPPANPDTP
ncbi:MAG: hypothetical protein JST44_05780 [Cyanobacteria bacterium SZAS LIN-5]|nr:hypothetical protein [Cyanobacteria bacterium SZAS LIN-5]RTL41040.1 MAG: hypothetical protein EKK48_15020 [Candidatus Melainabacteria bacterium]